VKEEDGLLDNMEYSILREQLRNAGERGNVSLQRITGTWAVRQLILLLGLIGVGLLFPEISRASFWEHFNKGNEYYKAGRYEESLKEYKRAQEYNSLLPIVHYNTGNALYMGGRYEEAILEYQWLITSQDEDIRFKAYYNMGNSFFRLQRWQEALASYAKALDIDHTDIDCKYNIEVILKHLEEQPQQQQPPPPSPDQDKKDNQQPPSNGQQPPPPGSKDQPPPMSQEDIQRVLQALKEQEEKALKDKPKPGYTPLGKEKDW